MKKWVIWGSKKSIFPKYLKTDGESKRRGNQRSDTHLYLVSNSIIDIIEALRHLKHGQGQGGGRRRVLVARAPTMLPGRPALEMEICTESGGQIAFSSEIFNFLCSEKLCPLSVQGGRKISTLGVKKSIFRKYLETDGESKGMSGGVK